MSSRAQRIVCVALVLALPLAQGCSFTLPRDQAITITSTEPDVEILVDGMPVGNGTAAPLLDRTRSHTILVRTKDGRSGVSSVSQTISPMGILDLVGGFFFLVPFIGIAAPGFWRLQPESVVVYVPPAKD
ncbi:MAG: hypothetical protein AAF517_13185 [Planctomycetota bacterium]